MKRYEFIDGQTVYIVRQTGSELELKEYSNCIITGNDFIQGYIMGSFVMIGFIHECFSTREDAIQNIRDDILNEITLHEIKISKCNRLLQSEIFKIEKTVKKSKSTIDEIIKNYLIKLGDEIGIHLELLTIYTDSIFIRIRNNTNNFISIDYDNITSINEDEYECLFDIINIKIKNNLNYSE